MPRSRQQNTMYGADTPMVLQAQEPALPSLISRTHCGLSKRNLCLSRVVKAGILLRRLKKPGTQSNFSEGDPTL